jgi:hypothetical protein
VLPVGFKGYEGFPAVESLAMKRQPPEERRDDGDGDSDAGGGAPCRPLLPPTTPPKKLRRGQAAVLADWLQARLHLP